MHTALKQIAANHAATENGQALIETIFCFALISSVVGFFGLIIFINTTQLILDKKADQITLCLAHYEKRNCRAEGIQTTIQQVPWVIIESYQEQITHSKNGYKKVRLNFIARTQKSFMNFNTHGELTWRPLTFKISRSFSEEKMKRASR